MKNWLREPFDAFLDRLASREPTPGGGSVSAAVGALASGLVSMVGRLNDKKSGEPGPLHDAIEPSERLRARLSTLIQEDTERFESLMAAWQLPKEDPRRASAVEQAAVAATRTPLEIMSNSLEVMRLAAVAIARSKASCRSDAVIALLLGHAALSAARQNVVINLPQVPPELAAGFRAEESRLRQEAEAIRTAAQSTAADDQAL